MIQTQLKRFYRWKYSGWLVIPLLVGFVWLAYDGMVQQNEFFDGFSCDMLRDFDREIKVRGHTIDELNYQQRVHFDEILLECKNNGK